MVELDVDPGGSVKHQYIASLLMSLTTFSYGCAVGWLSPSLATLKDVNSPLGRPLNEKEMSLMASLICVGAMVGTPIFGIVTDRFGRKIAGLMCAVPYTVSFILQLTAKSVAPMLVARFAAGMGGAGGLLVAPLYASEVASTCCRGKLGSFSILAINAGILYAYIIGSYVGYYTFIWVLLAVPVTFFICFLFMPETPSYLVKKGKIGEATKSIAWLRGVLEDSRISRQVLARIQNDQTLINQSKEEMASIKEILLSKVTIKAFVICFILVSFQGYMGMFAIMSYASSIFVEAGGNLSPSTSSIILAALQLLGECISIVLIERMGRKRLFMASAAVVSFGMVTLGTYLYYKEHDYNVSQFGWVPLLGLSLAVMVFSVGVGPVPFVITAEVFMIQVRGITTTVVILWLWVTAFMVAQFYNPAVTLLGTYGTFWGFALIAMSAVLFALFFVPETKGKHLNEILDLFHKRNNSETRQRESPERSALI